VRKLVVDSLAPLQLGVGLQRGVEAAIHATRLYTSNLPDDHAIVKLDIKNAFNSIRRDSMLETIKTELPECYAYIHSAYASSSLLLFDNHVISSEEGVQQGDPLGPLLFSLTIQPIIRQCKSDLHIAYLDDITLGGNTSVLNDDVNMIKAEALKIGLELNESKCELISKLNPVDVPVAFSLFTLIDPSEATLLGSPLSTSKAMDQTLEKRINNFKAASDRLKLLTSHDALVILKHSLSIPSLLHNLRSSPCNGHPLLQVFDGELRKSLSSILNVDLDDNQWIQATLPFGQVDWVLGDRVS